MKRILLLLLLATSLGTIGQKLAPTKLVITNNINSPSAPFVNVQESNGEVNKIAKADLIDVLNFASAVNLPTTGVSGKIYVTNDDNKIYRWNGTIYQPLSGAASTVNTAFTQKTFAASMSVAHNPANPNFFVNITGNFSLSITGTQNGDSGIVNLYFSGTQVATLTATVTINKIITGASALVQVYFIHDSQGLKWYRDESGDGSSLNLAQVLSNGSTGNGPIYINDTEVDPTASTTIYGNSTVVTDFVTGQDTRQEPSKFVFFDGNNSFANIKSRHDGGIKQKDFFLPNKPTGEYTLATLDDIGSGGAPNLQSVLNAGTYAENLAGNSSMELLGQNGGNGLSYISHSDDFGKGSGVSINPFKAELNSRINGDLKSTIKVDNGNVVISKETLNLTTNVSNTIGINIPTVNTTTNFPAKTVAGNYLFKTIPLNSYTVATLPAAVLNDEATVTDATSDAALTGGGSLTIPVWYNGTAWTKLGGGTGTGITTEKGVVLNGSFIASDYSLGSNISISSGNLIIANGEDNYSSVSNVAINTAYQGTNITKWTSSFDATIPVITGTSYGFSFGLNGTRPAYFRFCTDSVKKGLIEVYLNGALYATSFGTLPISDGDTSSIKIRREINTFVISWKNTITNRQLDFTIPCDAFYSTGVPPNFGNFVFWGHGGATTINNLVVANNLRENSKLAIVIDSEGSSTTRNSEQNFISLLSDRVVENVTAYVGNSNKIEDNNWAEIVATNPENILIYCLTNNISNGDSTALMLSKLATAITTLNSSGYTYGTNLFICNIAPRNDVDVSSYNTALEAAYSNTIDVYTSFKNPLSSGILSSLSQDGIHRTPKGHLQEVNIIANYFKDISVLNYKNSYKTYNSTAYLDREGNLVLGETAPFKASHDLEFQNTYADKTQLYFRDSTTSGTSIGTATNISGWITGAEITSTGLKATATTFYGWAIQGGNNYYVYRTGATIGVTYSLSSVSASQIGYVDYVNKSFVIDNPLKYNLATTGASSFAIRNSYNVLPTLTSANGSISALPSGAKHGDRVAVLNNNTSTLYSWSVLGTIIPNGLIYEYLFDSVSSTWKRVNNTSSFATTKTANYTTLASDETILVDATAGNITITLLVASGNSGKKFTVKKIDSTANTVTVTNSTNIDGATTKTYSTQYSGGSFQSNGTQYFIIGNF